MASLSSFSWSLIRHQRCQTTSAGVRRLVQAGSFFVFYYVVYSCLGVFGMIRNGLYGMTLLGTAYSESFYWLALPVAIISVTLLARNRYFAAGYAPRGPWQDLAGWLRKRFPRHQERLTRGKFIGSDRVRGGLSRAAGLGWGAKRQLLLEDSSVHWAAMLILLCYPGARQACSTTPLAQARLFSLVAIFSPGRVALGGDLADALRLHHA